MVGRKKLETLPKNAAFVRAQQLEYRGGTWARDVITGEMDWFVRLADGSQVARKSTQMLYVKAHLEGTSPLNPFNRRPFTRQDEKTIFQRPQSTRGRDETVSTFAEWLESEEGKLVYERMRAEREQGEAIRRREREEEDMRLAASLAALPDDERLIYEYQEDEEEIPVDDEDEEEVPVDDEDEEEVPVDDEDEEEVQQPAS